MVGLGAIMIINEARYTCTLSSLVKITI